MQILIKKYFDGTISLDEMHQLDEWYDSFDAKPDLYTPGTINLKEARDKAFAQIKNKLWPD